MRRSRLALAASLVLAALAAGPAAARDFTLAEYQASLDGAKPMTVVFDIDDTALFSSYAMVMAEGAFRVHHPEVARPYDDCRLFEAVNDSLDAKYSRPKKVAAALIAFHVARGDRVTFVTKRCASDPPTDATSRYLAKVFDLKEPPVVRFTDLGKKVAAFQELGAAISYGDADSDIEDTLAASTKGSPIRAVRIIRSSFSSNPGAMNPGKFGEDVILGSDL
jgi:acid phosphatase (class B)